MQHQVLARKWRPRSFSEMVGQTHVLRALINALDHNRLHHAYLFTGTRGVGKTTIARILAKSLNCQTGVTSEPCNQCSTCIEINEGRCVDLIEVDAASRTKVEDTRELLDNVQYAPTRARFKVYLIDEVHMLSTHSFNALLKTLEEPPEHVKFLLATTDPQKLPVTILSRCLQFNLKNMLPESIVSHLQLILKSEQINYEEAALWQLARAADGSMRDALSLTDQAIAYGNGQLSLGDVTSMLGTVANDRVEELLDALVKQEAGRLLQLVNDLAQFSCDFQAVLESLISSLHRIAIAQVAPEAIDPSAGDPQTILAFAQQLTPQDLQLFYQIALLSRRDLPLNPDPKAGLEMALLRMLAFKPASATDKLAASKKKDNAQTHHKPDLTAEIREPSQSRQPQQAQPIVIAEKPEPQGSSGIAQVMSLLKSNPAATASVPEVNRLKPEPVAPAGSSNPAESRSVPEKLASPSLPSIEKTPRVQGKIEPATDTQEQIVANISLQPLESNSDWIRLVEKLSIKGMAGNLMAQSVFKSLNTQRLELCLRPEFHELANENQKSRIQIALAGALGFKPELIFVAELSELESPAECRSRLKQERLQEARESLVSDPVTQALFNQFDAQIEEQSIEPIDQ